MLFDYFHIGNGTYKATGRCIKEELLAIIGKEDEVKALVKEKYEQLCNEYYDDNFKRDSVYVDGNIVELRNGAMHKIEGNYAEIIKCVKTSSGRKIYKYNFDKYCYYGVNATLDVVKIYDSEMKVIAERSELDPLSTKEFIV